MCCRRPPRSKSGKRGCAGSHAPGGSLPSPLSSACLSNLSLDEFVDRMETIHKRACRHQPQLSASVQGESCDCAFESGTRRVKPYVVLIRIGCHGLVVSQSSSRRSKEHCLYSCGSLVLHVWKNVSISIQRKGRARVSKLLRNNFGRHSAANAIVAAEWRKS